LIWVSQQGGNVSEDLNQEKLRQLAATVATQIAEEDRPAVLALMRQLLEIRDSELPRYEQARAAYQATAQSGATWALAKMAAGALKEYAWDSRSTSTRLGLSGLAVVAAAFARQTVGIAALGALIGVPLWIVFGASGQFPDLLIEELSKMEASRRSVQ